MSEQRKGSYSNGAKAVLGIGTAMSVLALGAKVNGLLNPGEIQHDASRTPAASAPRTPGETQTGIDPKIQAQIDFQEHGARLAGKVIDILSQPGSGAHLYGDRSSFISIENKTATAGIDGVWRTADDLRVPDSFMHYDPKNKKMYFAMANQVEGNETEAESDDRSSSGFVTVAVSEDSPIAKKVADGGTPSWRDFKASLVVGDGYATVEEINGGLRTTFFDDKAYGITFAAKSDGLGNVKGHVENDLLAESHLKSEGVPYMDVSKQIGKLVTDVVETIDKMN